MFPFVHYLFCFRPPNRLFFHLKTIFVVSSIRHSVLTLNVMGLYHGHSNKFRKMHGGIKKVTKHNLEICFECIE